MAYDFREWFACPACDERDAVSVLAHRDEVILECYECDHSSEYVIGDDVPLRGLEPDAIADAIDEGTHG